MKLSDFKEFEIKEVNQLKGGIIASSEKHAGNNTTLWNDGDDEFDEYSYTSTNDKYDDSKGDPHLGQPGKYG